MAKNCAQAVDRLLQGIASDQVTLVREAWQTLHETKEISALEIRRRLRTNAWETVPQGPSTRYFGVLLAILHELDPQEFRNEVKRLSNPSLNPLHRLTLNWLAQRCNDLPAAYVSDQTPLYVSNEIDDKTAAVGLLSKWSATPGICLDGVTRIDVIAQNRHLDYLGLYSPYYSRIVLTWDLDNERGLIRWLRKLKLEQTFYHEVGHHVLGHLDRGQVPEQEKEADRYAARLLKRSRPITVLTIRILLWPYFFYRRVKRGRSQ